MNVVIGAGAMGAAIAVQIARARGEATLLGTKFDEATIEALQSGRAHPALAVVLPAAVTPVSHDNLESILAAADVVVVGVSSAGLLDVVEEAVPHVRPGALWVIATKGWDDATLESPSEIVGAVLGGIERVAILAGPVLAPELVAGAPSVFVCASMDPNVGQEVTGALAAGDVSVATTDDVIGAETASAYKNVVAIAVGIAEGLAERLSESVYIHRFANARAAVFAQGLDDMSRLATARGGRSETVQGLAGAGDLYVTCLGGRNGSFGRLLGAGQSPDQALATIGSTVEGVANATAALALAERHGVALPVAKAVDAVLSSRASADDAIRALLVSGR